MSISHLLNELVCPPMLIFKTQPINKRHMYQGRCTGEHMLINSNNSKVFVIKAPLIQTLGANCIHLPIPQSTGKRPVWDWCLPGFPVLKKHKEPSHYNFPVEAWWGRGELYTCRRSGEGKATGSYSGTVWGLSTPFPSPCRGSTAPQLLPGVTRGFAFQAGNGQ